MTGSKPIRFIDEEIEIHFDQLPVLEKKPGCPDGFTWQDRSYRVTEMLAEWSDFTRRGKFARNMTPGHAAKGSGFCIGRCPQAKRWELAH